jgi:hypothetical protein
MTFPRNLYYFQNIINITIKLKIPVFFIFLYNNMSATDSLIMSNSLQTPNIDLPFVSKRIVTIADLNSGNYSSGEIKFETTGLASVNSYSDYDNGVIAIPIVMGCSVPSFDFEAQRTDLLLALKSGTVNLIDRLTIVSDGTTLINQTANINQLLSYELNTKMSDLDTKIWGETINYNADTPNSWKFNNAASTSGIGLCNNVNLGVECDSSCRTSASGDGVFNKGMYARSSRFAKNSDSRGFLSDRSCQDLAQDWISNVPGRKVYYVTAFIRLKDLLFFNNLPLTKSMLLSITINLNAPCSFEVTKTAAGVYSTPASTSFTGATNPIQLASSWVYQAKQISVAATESAVFQDSTLEIGASSTNSPHIYLSPGSASIAAGAVMTFTLGVVSAMVGAERATHKLTSCSLLIPTYILDAQVERSYLSLGKKKHIFWDVASSVFTVPANSSFSQYLGSKPRLQKIIIVPQLTAEANKGIDPMRSPYYSAPATPSPMLASLIGNFNVEIGGVFAYPSAVKYSYEHFINELGYDSLNGNTTHGLATGVLSKQAFENEYGYLVVKVRKDAVNANSDLAVRIQGDSYCKLGMNLYCYLVYEKSCDINLVTGVVENIVA